jgi:NAD+ diphosphatase
MPFVHRHTLEAKPAAIDYCLVIQGDRLLARTAVDSGVVLPLFKDLADWPGHSQLHPALHTGSFDERSVWMLAIGDDAVAAPAGWDWHETRSLLAAFTPAQMHAVSCARELSWWQNRHRFCGHCGAPTVDAAGERAKRCPSCQTLFYPVVSPAIIVAVTRGDQLLLAHNRNFRPGMFSLLAGFVDPGETLEQAVVREVREEVGIEIGGLHYVTSQPWPFPNSLMVGFCATHCGGEIAVDGQEIEQAGWYFRDALPEIPRPGTMAHSLITRWLQG